MAPANGNGAAPQVQARPIYTARKGQITKALKSLKHTVKVVLATLDKDGLSIPDDTSPTQEVVEKLIAEIEKESNGIDKALQMVEGQLAIWDTKIASAVNITEEQRQYEDESKGEYQDSAEYSDPIDEANEAKVKLAELKREAWKVLMKTSASTPVGTTFNTPVTALRPRRIVPPPLNTVNANAGGNGSPVPSPAQPASAPNTPVNRGQLGPLSPNSQQQMNAIMHVVNRGPQSNSAGAPLATASRANMPQQYQVAQVKLPPVHLPHFDGKPENWTRFLNTFERLVESQMAYSSADKMRLLRSCLCESAQNTIRYLEDDGGELDVSLDMLAKRYGDRGTIQQALNQKLHSLPQAHGSSQSCEDTLAEIRVLLHELGKVGEPNKGSAITDQVLSKFPAAIREKVYESLAMSHIGRNWSTDDALDTVHKQLSLLKLKEDKDLTRNAWHNRNTHTMTVMTQNCAFCGGGHANWKCTSSSLSDRRKIAREKQLCFKCTSSGHMADKCTISPRFVKLCSCGKEHHILLCPGKQAGQNRTQWPPRQNHFNQSQGHNSNWRREPSRGDDQRFRREGPPQQQNRQMNNRRGHMHMVQEAYEGQFVEDPRNMSNRREEYDQQSHPPGFPQPNFVQQDEFQPSVRFREFQSYATVGTSPTQAALQTGIMEIRDESGNFRPVKVFVDSGSHVTFIRSEVARSLNVKVESKSKLNLITFGSPQPRTVDSTTVLLEVIDRNGELVQIPAEAVKNLTGKIESARLTKDDLEFIKKNKVSLSDPDPSPHDVEVDVLVGADTWFNIFLKPQDKMICLPSGLVLTPTSFGYVAGGVPHSQIGKTWRKNVHTHTIQNLERLWNLETVGIKDDPTPAIDEEVTLESYLQTVQIKDKIPFFRFTWKAKAPDIPDNFGLAMRRLESVLRKLGQTPDLLKQYDKCIQDQLAAGIVEDVPEGNPLGTVHFLAHQPVLTPNKTTTKLRVVYDASAKLKGCLSLNDALHAGPVLLPNLVGMLVRFRIHKYVAISDVEKAYLQVRLQETEKDAVRFVWLWDLEKPATKENIRRLRFTRLPFGINCSPFILAACIIYHLTMRQNGVQSIQGLEEELYVDNLIQGAETRKQLIEDCTKAKETFHDLLMNLREFRANDHEVNHELESLGLAKDANQKVLGIAWDTENDVFNLTGLDKMVEPVTKRKVVQIVAKVFDPQGFLSPLFFKAKNFVQFLWKQKYDWDSKLEEAHMRMWREIERDTTLETISIPRRYPGFSQAARVEMIVFVDASQLGYAAAVYVRCKDDDGVKTSLVMAKSRVMPVAGMTIPRAELTALVIGIRLARFVWTESKGQIPFQSCHVFGDSQIALRWVENQTGPDLFIRNRVRSIHEMIKGFPVSFRYVNTKDNPADAATRGFTGKEMTSDLWWNGPKWLEEDENDWPVIKIEKDKKGSEEAKIEEVHAVFQQKESYQALFPDEEILGFQKMSRIAVNLGRALANWRLPWLESRATLGKSKAVRDKAKRAIEDLLKRFPHVREYGHPGDVVEGDTARECEKILFRDHQKQHLTEVELEKFSNLDPQVGEDGIVRCRGRLGNISLPDSAKFPILIMPRTKFTDEFILALHEDCLHSGSTHILAATRGKVWIPQGLKTVRDTLAKCTTCRKANGRSFKYPSTPDLPIKRIMAASPFENIGLDYCGPFVTRNTEGRERKVFILLLTCTTTRAIHLECVKGMDIVQFIMALIRFFSLRRVPRSIVSDNAPTFHLTDTILKEREKIPDHPWTSFLEAREINWKFIPAYAPWVGGVYERMVRNVKQAFYKSVGTRVLTGDEFRTICYKIASVVNDRPLCYVSETEESFEILRPSSFLNPQRRVYTDLDIEFDPTKPSAVNTREAAEMLWAELQDLVDWFGEKWKTHYILSLREKHKLVKGPRGKCPREPQVGEIVIVQQEMVPRGSWPLARVVELERGDDGQVRSVKLRSSKGRIISRAVNHLIPLELTTSEELTKKEDRQEEKEKEKVEEKTHRYNLRERKPVNYAESHRGGGSRRENH